MALSRRKAREAALRVLYEIEVGRTQTALALRQCLEELSLTPPIEAYVYRLVEGVRQNLAEIDDLIEARLLDYSLDRIAVVDRNVLRIATYELFHEPALPPAVTMDEAIEIAKKYSTAESGRFVNGVLSKILHDSPKTDWDPATAPEEDISIPDDGLELVEAVEEVDIPLEQAQKLAKIGGWTLRSDEGVEEAKDDS